MAAASVMKFLDQAFDRSCPGQLKESFSAAALHSQHVDSDGVFHGVLILPSGKMQYVAAEGGELLLAEPSIHCPSSLTQQEPLEPPSVEPPSGEPPSGEPLEPPLNGPPPGELPSEDPEE